MTDLSNKSIMKLMVTTFIAAYLNTDGTVFFHGYGLVSAFAQTLVPTQITTTNVLSGRTIVDMLASDIVMLLCSDGTIWGTGPGSMFKCQYLTL
jgi:alpha-tubulin suppressor-like RCC1 family protein